jgi:eukaryotic-like serine/threonine-protein kinase
VLSSGHLLDNRYRLDERIASGGMGDVWRGTDVVLGRTVAVKVLRPAMMADPEFAARFYGEARMMAAFRHPGVVEVYDYNSADDSADDDTCAYLVMAYVEGEPLSTRLKEAGRLSVGETMSIVAQTADALQAAHSNGTIHRDVKPGNLIVKPNGAVVLVDFGVARSNAVTSMTGVNSIVGTALYMAPEQVAKGRVTPATDIYALGALAYHCLAGRPPFDGDNALQVALRHLEDEPDPLPDDVTPAARALVARAMAKNPADRFDSAADLARAALAARAPMDWAAVPSGAATATAATTPLSPAPAHAAVPTRTVPAPVPVPPAVPPARRRTPRSQLIVLLTVIGLLLLAAGLAIALALSGNDDNPGLGGTPAEQPSTGATGSPGPGQPVPTGSASTTRKPRLNGATVKPPVSRPRTSTKPSTATTTTGPTTRPTTTPPVTEPTTTPTTTTATPTGGTTTGTAGAGGNGAGSR